MMDPPARTPPPARTITRDVRRHASLLLARARPGRAPALYRLEEYARWFTTTGTLFSRSVARHRSGAGTTPGGAAAREPGTVGVVVGPWVSTPMPWYQVMLALGLARRGRGVVLLVDDTGFPEDRLEEQQQVISQVLAGLADDIPLVRVGGAAPAAPRAGDAELVADLTQQNLTWILRGAPRTEADEPLRARVETSLRTSLPFIRQVVARPGLDTLVVPGGVYGASCLFRLEAQAGGIRVATVDSDQGVGQICVDGVAAQSGDIPRAFQTLWSAGAEERDGAVAVARAEFRRRTESRDGYGFQTVPADSAATGSDGSILFPLNVEWDTAALGRHRHFENSLDWLTETIAVILEADAGPVVVRQHPSERRRFQRSNLAIGELLRQRFGADERLRFVAAEDPVNTYDLLRSARLVLPFVSTIAIEAAALAKPVVVSGAAYYAELGFVRSAATREEYFSLVRRGLTGQLELLPDQVERAWVCFYLTAVRNRIPTDFTPHPADFWSWVARDPVELFADPEVADMLAAIDLDEPVSLRRHRRLSEPAGVAP